MTPITRPQDATGRDARHDAPRSSAVMARSALEHWHWAIRGLPFTGCSDEVSSALRALADWYERICVDDAYGNPAPADGLIALVAQGSGTARPVRRVLVAYWAVRVAQELAECRRQGFAADDESPAAVQAHTNLDLTLWGAWERLR